MISFLNRTISLLLLISLTKIYSQVDAYLPNPDQLDTLDIQQQLLVQEFDDTGFYIFKNLIHQNNDGLADIVRYSNDYQVFDFAYIGRPRYLAPVNMFPHQLKINLNNEILNQSANGLFNTRFLSADQVKSLTQSTNSFTSYKNISNLNPLEKDTDEPFTRVKFYEGDNRYTDLDIYFVRDVWHNAKLKLAGFNKGYDGSAFNNAHNGVMYDTRLIVNISKKLESEIFWNRNHERAGMFTLNQNHTYRMDASRTGVKFSYIQDSINSDKIEAGFTSVVNRLRNRRNDSINNDRVTQNSDDYKFYALKEFSTENNYLTALLSIDKQYIWGNAFPNFSQTLLSANLFDRFNINRVNYYEAGLEVQSLTDSDPIVNGSLSWNFQSRPNLFSRIKAYLSQRYPTPVESSVNYSGYHGNPNLKPETMMGLSVLQKWQLLDFLLLQGEVGYNKIHNEIGFNSNTFHNAGYRDWSYISGEGHLKFWKFIASSGGRILSANEYISPKQSAWAKLIFHGDLIDGTIIIDASTNVRWYSRHDALDYNSALSRFYRGVGENASSMAWGFKIVGTVRDAEFFLEMDNFMDDFQQYINSYNSDLSFFRFGVNWVLWD